jgi:hypothetical protein
VEHVTESLDYGKSKTLVFTRYTPVKPDLVSGLISLLEKSQHVDFSFSAQPLLWLFEPAFVRQTTEVIHDREFNII